MVICSSSCSLAGMETANDNWVFSKLEVGGGVWKIGDEGFISVQQWCRRNLRAWVPWQTKFLACLCQDLIVISQCRKKRCLVKLFIWLGSMLKTFQISRNGFLWVLFFFRIRIGWVWWSHLQKVLDGGSNFNVKETCKLNYFIFIR